MLNNGDRGECSLLQKKALTSRSVSSPPKLPARDVQNTLPHPSPKKRTSSPKSSDKFGERRSPKEDEGDTSTRIVSGALGMVEAVTITTSKIASVLRGKSSASNILLANGTTAAAVGNSMRSEVNISSKKTQNNPIFSSPKCNEKFDPRNEPDMKFNDKVIAWLNNNPLSVEEATTQGILNQKSAYPARTSDTFSDYSDDTEGREQEYLKRTTKLVIEKYRREPATKNQDAEPESTKFNISPNYMKGGYENINEINSPSQQTTYVSNNNNHSNISNIRNLNFLNNNNFLTRLKNMHCHPRQNHHSVNHHRRRDNSIDNSNEYSNYSSHNISNINVSSRTDEDHVRSIGRISYDINSQEGVDNFLNGNQVGLATCFGQVRVRDSVQHHPPSITTIPGHFPPNQHNGEHSNQSRKSDDENFQYRKKNFSHSLSGQNELNPSVSPHRHQTTNPITVSTATQRTVPVYNTSNVLQSVPSPTKNNRSNYTRDTFTRRFVQWSTNNSKTASSLQR